MTDIIKAIRAINPSAEVSVNADDINQITWLNNTPIISNCSRWWKNSSGSIRN
jgi:hypothetical protein